MNTANFSKFLAMGLILAIGVVGCKKTPRTVTYIPPGTAPVTGPDKPSGPTGTRPPERTPERPPDRTIEPGVPVPPGTSPTPTKTNPDGTTQLPDTREILGNYIVDREQFKEQTVYFDFDSSVVKPGEKSKVDAVAAFLKGNPTFRMLIEGHCDERGTDEYNRALGERRALSVREYLISVGINAERISTISFGEDKPAVLGHDEAAWGKNRRGEFVSLKPKE